MADAEMHAQTGKQPMGRKPVAEHYANYRNSQAFLDLYQTAYIAPSNWQQLASKIIKTKQLFCS